MEQLQNDSAVAAWRDRRPVLTLGTFDGVHLGHRALFERARELSDQAGVPSVALTFHPHPAQVAAPSRAPLMIGTLKQRLGWLAMEGLDAAWTHAFDQEIAALSPKAFVARLHALANPTALVVGYDFGFGQRRAGKAADLVRLAQALGIQTVVLPPKRCADGSVISSTAIRLKLAEGQLREASLRLGRPVELIAEVERGAGRGQGLGFGTANLKPKGLAMPGQGVYAAFAQVEGRIAPAAVNIGVVPTFGALKSQVVEVHLLDPPSESLLGKELRLRFVQRLRGEKRFSGPEPLRAQIACDLKAIQAQLGSKRGQAIGAAPWH